VRVTNSMQNMQLLNNLRQTNKEILRWQDLLATGQKIQRPGDDPVGVNYLLRYDTELNRSEVYLENARTALGMLKTMDTLMQQADDVLKRARVLVQQGANGTNPQEALNTIAAEIRQLREQMVAIANSSYAGRYLFNGQKTDQPPYSLDNAATDRTDKGVFFLNVSPLVKVPVSITGELIFGPARDPANPQEEPENVFVLLENIEKHLLNGEQQELFKDLEYIDAAADRIMVSWAEIGARTNRFELVESRILDEQASLKELRSSVTDVDMANAITELKLKENVLQAALGTGARIMQVSLIDFLR